MQRTMTLKGFALILSLILLAFLALHLMLKGDLNRKAEMEKVLQSELAKLQEENKDLQNRLEVVGTEEYILSSAKVHSSFVKPDDIRFEFSNPEALYAYTAEELRILVDEMAE